MNKEQPPQLYPELVSYWAEHGPEIQQQHAGEFLVLVVNPKTNDVKPEYYSGQDRAIARSRKLGSRSVFVTLQGVNT